MRKKLVIAATAGALTLTGLAVAAPALAATDTAADAVSSRIDRIKDALSDLVGDGSITQEQADEVATTLSEAGLGGPGGHHGRGPDLAAAAEALGMSEDDLHTALEADGVTLAQVAEDQGVAVDTVVQALVTAGQERPTSGWPTWSSASPTGSTPPSRTAGAATGTGPTARRTSPPTTDLQHR